MIRLLLLLIVLAPMAHAQQPLASYVDQKRVLLLFASGRDQPLYLQQLTELDRHAADLKERDLVVIPVLLDPTPPVTPNTLRVTLGPGLPDQEQLPVRHRFDVAANAFAVLLIGKDGGEKFRSDRPVAVEKLNQVIDAMPMRQAEMRARAHGR